MTAIQCLWIIALFRPDIVLGMGGYSTGPVLLLAALLGLPTAIAEQNAVAGRTNRILGRFVRRVFISFPESKADFPRAKVRITGNPVRRELLEAAHGIDPPRWQAQPEETFHLLIFGGSQGALAINRTLMAALPSFSTLPFRLEVMHQAGSQLLHELGEAYSSAGISHRVLSFIERMDEAYRWAHLVLCRAGATSLAEIALFKRPSILIPLPHAADDHQSKNARLFENAGAAIMIQERDLTGETLTRVLADLASDPERLRHMGQRAESLARRDAADHILTECLRLVGSDSTPIEG
jgi:UDP-N-acetylglucosamine--N-acetylmuramyl-(pentapeptide) pyrophosphoryl-undecaprenol N-acetylglucosamine transferase